MEPANLNSSSDANDDARLEAILRCSASPLADAGFSARVLAALPPVREQPAKWSRVMFCVAGAVGGGIFAIWQGASWPDLQSGVEHVGTALVNLALPFTNPLVGAAVVVTLLSLLVAFRNELRDKLLS